ncbi:hypothetical protein [Wenzhouxiangella sp. XN201]|uniref:hypothetical protein n=1 Tax=Wenzhouxiangella sp. XN201 TaxID=2710755 RepID=UPI0013DD1C57|nr:hypothetical protein [Wenzhouxiangella sp. XN201]
MPKHARALSDRYLLRPIGLLFGTLSMLSAPLLAADFGEYRSDGGRIALELRADYLKDFGVEVRAGMQVLGERHLHHSRLRGEFRAHLSSARFGRFSGGRLYFTSDLSLGYDGAWLSLEELTLSAGADTRRPSIAAAVAGGDVLLELTHLHTNLAPEGRELVIDHADVVATPALARRIGYPALAGQVLGSARLVLDVADFEPVEQVLTSRGAAACEGRPYWPQDGHRADIALTGIDGVQYQGRDSGRVKLAPSAWLKNLGEADVPWIAKFEENAVYPYAPNDQHPYLVWSLYRLHEGRIEQLGVSGAKHAFNTVNLNCDLICDYFEVNSNNGDVLGPGCEDVYGASTNDMNSAMGPRGEIVASQGGFSSTNSFFDQNGDGMQDHDSGEYENRLLVDESELSNQGARYFIDAWYLVQCDADISNSMGYVEIDPQMVGDGWTFDLLSSFEQGSAINLWVYEGSEQSLEHHERFEVASSTPDAGCPEGMPQGHARLAVRVEQLSDDRYVYRYALVNHDIDRGINRFVLPGVDGSRIDGLASPEGGWSSSVVDSCRLQFQTSDEALDWGQVRNFELISDFAPRSGHARIHLVGPSPPQSVAVETLVPDDQSLLFCDRFDSPAN